MPIIVRDKMMSDNGSIVSIEVKKKSSRSRRKRRNQLKLQLRNQLIPRSASSVLREMEDVKEIIFTPHQNQGFVATFEVNGTQYEGNGNAKNLIENR